MLERGYPEVSPHDFYRELFPTVAAARAGTEKVIL